MSFYIRKSIKLGPIRINISKSGIGFSAGVKGARIGTGPSGKYVHAGRKGLYYRKSLSSGSRRVANNRKHEQDSACEYVLPVLIASNITHLVDSGALSLVKELNEKRQKRKLWPIVVVLGLLITAFTYFQTSSQNLLLSLIALFTVLSVFAFITDRVKKSTTLKLELDPELDELYKNLKDSFAALSSASKVWHVSEEGAVMNNKSSAGADTLVERTTVLFKSGGLPNVKSNMSFPLIAIGDNTLYFLPDKILLFTSQGIGGVSYSNVDITINQVRYAEHNTLPSDAEVIDWTWRYVNKNGGPDRRYKDNPEFPIVLYEEIELTSVVGLNLRLHISKLGVSNNFATAITKLASVIYKDG